MMSSLIATPLLPYKKNQRRRRRTKITSNENEKEISKKKTKPRKQNTKPNYIDQDEDLSKEVPRATKKKRREAELPDFEKNVIMKNIEERKKMERELGLYNLSADMRNIDKPTSTFQERLDYFMGDDVQIERKLYVHSSLGLHPAEIGWLGIGQCK